MCYCLVVYDCLDIIIVCLCSLSQLLAYILLYDRFGNPTSQIVFNGLGGYTYLGQLLSHDMNKDGKVVLHRDFLSTTS